MSNEAKIIEKKPDGTVVRLPKEEDEFQLFQRLDEMSVVEVMEGKIKTDLGSAIVDQWFYNYKADNGDIVVDLTLRGVMEYAGFIGGIDITSCEVTENEESFTVMACAKDHFKNASRFGACVQPKFHSNGKVDPFALPKATSKAQRNAMKLLLMASHMIELVKFYEKDKEEKDRLFKIQAIKEIIEKHNLDEKAISVRLSEVYNSDSIDKLSPDLLDTFHSQIEQPRYYQKFVKE